MCAREIEASVTLTWRVHVSLTVYSHMCKGPGSSVWDLCKGPEAWGNQGEVPVSGLSGEFGSTCVVDGPNT